jgi:hypothetical protein
MDWTIEVRFPAGAKDFSSSLCVQTGSEAHSASCTMGTGGPFSGDKARPGRDSDYTPHLVPWSRMSRSYTSYDMWVDRQTHTYYSYRNITYNKRYWLVPLPPERIESTLKWTLFRRNISTEDERDYRAIQN